MAVVAALLMNVLAVPLVLVVTLLFLLISPAFCLTVKLVSRRENEWVAHLLTWIYGRTIVYLLFPFVRCRREHFDRLRREPPCMVVVNHQSALDLFLMGLLPFVDIVFAMRSWPQTKLFFFATFMRIGRYLNMEDWPWETILAETRAAASRARYLIFFPEGHRSRDGRLGRFHSGAFRLARELDIPIVPLCIVGSGRILRPGQLRLHPGTVRMRALPAVYPGDVDGDDELAHIALRKQVKQAMCAALDEMQTDHENDL